MFQNIVVVNYNSSTMFCSIILPFPHQRICDYIRHNVKPTSYRRWEDKTRRWEVHISKLAPVILYIKSFFNYVNYRSLPEAAQIKLVTELDRLKASRKGSDQGTSSQVKKESSSEDPYVILFVLPEAPWEVIKAAHQALVSIYHPDHGGSAEEFMRVQSAYEEIRKTRNQKPI